MGNKKKGHRRRHKKRRLEVATITNQLTVAGVSEIGLQIQRDSLRELASRKGFAENDHLRDLAGVYKKRIVATLESLSLLDVPPTDRHIVDKIVVSQQAAFNKLDDPYYVLEYRQAQVEEFYDLIVAKLEEWLELSPEAQAMLSSTHLESVEQLLDIPSKGSLTARCVRIARAVHIVSPFVASFNAETMKLVPIVKLFSGLVDCFYSASALIVWACVDEVDGQLEVRNLRSFPEDFESAVRMLREIVDMAVGLRSEAPQAQVPANKPALKVLEQTIYQGAVTFVVFHELGHLLLPFAANEFEEEHKSDAFASHIMAASHDPALICGLYIGQALVYAISAETEGWQSVFKYPQIPRTHPLSSNRAHRVATFIEQHGMMPTGPFDALLSVPTRLKEEEIFEHSTRWDVFSRLDEYFRNRPAGEIAEELRTSIPAGVVWAVRLPKLSESTEVTLQPEGEMRARIVTFDLSSAILAAGVMINERVIEDPLISMEEKDIAIALTRKQAVALALECLAVLANAPRPSSDATEVLYVLTNAEGQQRKRADLISDLGSQRIVNNGLPVLESLGCTSTNNRFIRILNNVNVRLVHKPKYIDRWFD